MAPSRREILRMLSLGTLAVPLLGHGSLLAAPGGVRKPSRLKAGDTVGLINPAGATYFSHDLKIVEETLEALGLASKPGRYAMSRYGYLAGKDAERAEDVNSMFADNDVQAILAIRGGWGCARILPLLDYDLISRHPKVLVGYSDITALILAVYARCGFATFHGPDGISTWNAFTVDYFKRVLFAGETVTMSNPETTGDDLAQKRDRVVTITGGTARGRLMGGNLSVLAGMVGSPYLPDWEGAILFLEDTGEDVYRVDRMITQLRLAGILDRLSAFVFGKCTRCGPGEGYGSLTLEEVFADHIRPLGIPAWYGAMIGHIKDKFTVPIGIEAEIDADAGTIRLLESAVA
jgi:muramoyltetrapeptide carboxypeptidase